LVSNNFWKNTDEVCKNLFSNNRNDFLTDLRKTLEVERGVGIAAPQVGISKNLFLFMRLELPDNPVHVAVNPKIINYPDMTILNQEL